MPPSINTVHSSNIKPLQVGILQDCGSGVDGEVWDAVVVADGAAVPL
jgi:hypothetical protein